MNAPCHADRRQTGGPLPQVEQVQIIHKWGTLILISCLLVLAALERADAAPPDSVQLQNLAGEVYSGRLKEISDSKIRLEGQPAIELNRLDVLRIDWLTQPESLLENGPQLLLANGDRLGIRPTEITEESLKGKWDNFPAWPEVVVPLETVRGALLIPPRNPIERSRAIVQLRDQTETQDYFYLSNGDRLPGQLTGLEQGTDEAKFHLIAASGKVSLPFGTVRCFGLNPELTSFPELKGMPALLTLTDGSLLTVTDVRFNGQGQLQCRAGFGADLLVPVDQLVSMQCLGDRIAYLGELDPEDFTSTPYLSRTWPLRRNQNAVGGPQRLNTREYARGLGMHSQSLVTYSLNGKFLSFQSLIGIDAVAEGRGSVIFRVLADGKPLFTSEVVRGKTPPIKVGPLSMKGVRNLTLAVDFADQGDILDHADWCDAVLIKAP